MYFRVSSDHGESASQDKPIGDLVAALRLYLILARRQNPTGPGVWRGWFFIYSYSIADYSKLLGQGRRCAYVALQTPIGKAIAFCNLLKLVLHRLVICLDHMPCSSSRMLHAGSPPRTCTHETRMMGKCILHFTFPAALAAQQDLFSECKAFTWPLS